LSPSNKSPSNSPSNKSPVSNKKSKKLMISSRSIMKKSNKQIIENNDNEIPNFASRKTVKIEDSGSPGSNKKEQGRNRVKQIDLMESVSRTEEQPEGDIHNEGGSEERSEEDKSPKFDQNEHLDASNHDTENKDILDNIIIKHNDNSPSSKVIKKKAISVPPEKNRSIPIKVRK
jgi:hypothetical protein